MKAVIFANSKFEGVNGKPKALSVILGKTILEYNCELIGNMVDEIIAVYPGEKGEFTPDINKVTFCSEEEFYGNKIKTLNETTVFMDGSIFYTCNMKKIIDFHKNSASKITVVLSCIRDSFLLPVSFEGDSIVKMKSDTKWSFNNLYILEKEMIGINVKRCIRKPTENILSVYPTKEKIYPVNNVWDLMKISFELINKTHSFVHKSTFVDESAEISRLSYVGKNCKIGKFVKIGAYTVIEDNCIIKDGADIKYSMICENSYVGRSSEIEFSFVMENSTIGDRCILQGGNVVGRNFVVCNDSVVEKNTSVEESEDKTDKKEKNKGKILK